MRFCRFAWPFGLIALAAVSGFWRVGQQSPAADFQAPLPAAAPAYPEPASAFVSLTPGPHRHAPSLVELKDGTIRAFWFSGSREGASDVVIASALFDPKSGRWSPERTVIGREETQAGLWRYVRKLGNPVAARAEDGALHLFYVTVSLGGWAGSSITRLVSTDGGEHWGAPRRLVTSPFLNISTLVKGAPFRYADGSLGLPVYHEFLGKFGEILRLDAAGQLIDKTRLSYGKTSLQPTVLVRDATRAAVLMRHSGDGPSRVVGVDSEDAGRRWSAPRPLSLANPNAAIAGLGLPGGVLLAVANDVEANREALSLAASFDGGGVWKTLAMLEDRRRPGAPAPDEAAYRKEIEQLASAAEAGAALASADARERFSAAASEHMCREAAACSFEFSYPYLIRTGRGDVHLAYTWNRSYIRHRVFTREWLAQRLEEAEHARGD